MKRMSGMEMWKLMSHMDLSPIKKVTMEEVHKAVKSMKLGEAAGVSEVAAEHIKASGMVGIEVLTGIANCMLDRNTVCWCIKGKGM